MATSGLRTFDPDLAVITAEAYARCGIRRLAIGAEHIEDAILSANFMLSDWATLGFKQFELAELTLALTPTVEQYVLPVGVLDIWDARLLRSGVTDPMFRISRTDYEIIPKKDVTGRADRYYVDRTPSGQRTVYLWPVPDRNTDEVRYTALRRPEDVTAMVETAPIPYEWLEAFAAGLAYRLAIKWAPDRQAGLMQLAQGDIDLNGGAFRRALYADRERAPAVFTVSRQNRGRR
jgi:hypothetical protein